MPEPQANWTAKGPTLIAGLILILAGLFASSRRAFVLAAVLVALGLAFVGYSLTIKNWCELHGTEFGQSAWGAGGFGGGIGDCLKEKGWLSF